MLILKGNWNFERLGAAWWRAILLGLLIAVAARAAPPLRTPDIVAAEFYGWYLDTLSADQDPLSDRHERFTAYVARDLTQRLIDRLQHKPPPDLDYFLQARSYEPAWRRGVHTSLLRVDRARAGDRADVLVALDGGDASARVLVLEMVVEAGAWKIRAVRAAPKSSPQQSAI